MAASKITLFDLRSQEPNRSWSLNAWRARFILNYKGLDYETEWLEYPDIKPRLQPHFPADKEEFTIPTIRLPDGRYIMHSFKIAEVLEELYPTPSLPPTSPLQEEYLDVFGKAWDAMGPVKLSCVPRKLLNEVNYPHWRKTRGENIGQPLDEAEVDETFRQVAPHLREVTRLLDQNKEGPFFMGSTITFTDTIHAGFLVMMRRLGDDIFQRVLEALGDKEVHLKFLEAVKPWTERDNY
ncbi:putative glutathione S-transferase [Xylariaceae sp. FL0594]|nr:putative glutathione S-transferase [Xylariaceae sp. FL0594]